MKARAGWVAAAAAAVLWLLVTAATDTEPFRHPDSRSYWHQANSLVDHGELRERFDTGTVPTSWRPPGYGFALSLAVRTGAGPGAAARGGQLALLVTALLLALCARRLGARPPVAAAVGLVYLWLPTANVLARSLMSESLFMLLSVAALAAALAADPERSRRAEVGRLLAVGALCGLALLTRTVFYALAPAIAYLAIASIGPGRRRSAALAVAAGLVVAVMPWTARNLALHHRLVVVNTAGAYNLYVGNVHDANGVKDRRTRAWLRELRGQRSEVAVADELGRRAVQRIRDRPGEAVGRWLGNAGALWLSTKGVSHSRTVQRLTAGIRLALLLLAALALYCNRRRRTLWALASAPLLLTGLHAVTFVDWRFALPAVPFLLLLAATLPGLTSAGSSRPDR